MKTAVQRWGNSLAFRIPKAYAAETRISDGTEVELSLKDGSLVIRPISGQRNNLEDLLAKITPTNQHGCESTGPAVGKEAW